jgi:ribosome-associated protein
MYDSLEAAQLCAEAADNKKAFDILILDLRGMAYITDFFVICSAGSTTQVSAVSDEIHETLAQAGVHASHVEGGPEATWVLMDFGDVVVHIFDEQTRAYYSLEKLWSDAPRIPVVLKPRMLHGASS